MKNKTTKELVSQNILLLLPLILYGLYKNGYLLYNKKLVSLLYVFKPLYFVLIGVAIKLLYDIIKNKKLLIDYDLVSLILIGMIVPYKTNLVIYAISMIVLYISSKLIPKNITYNKVCMWYVIIILINHFVSSASFLSPLELKYDFDFSFIDLLLGRSVGGISSTSIIFSLFAYTIFLCNNYYKKDIPFVVNITYLCLAIIYYAITKEVSILINSDLIFGSIFVSTLPEYSPYSVKYQVVFGVAIGAISFILSMYFSSIISVYLSTLFASLFLNINLLRRKKYERKN